MDPALRTGRQDFLDTSRKLADTFLGLLTEKGVPEWYVHLHHIRPFLLFNLLLVSGTSPTLSDSL